MVTLVFLLALAGSFRGPLSSPREETSTSLADKDSAIPSVESSPIPTPTPSVEFTPSLKTPSPKTESAPASRIEASYNVTSFSMEPAVKKGAVVIFTPVPFQSLKVDDIILFRQPNHQDNIVIARIVGIRDNSLVAKGDHNLVVYPWNVTVSMLIGKVTQINNP